MDIIIVFSLLAYFRGIIIYSIRRGHFLVILLSLEFITLSIYFSLFILINYQTLNLFFLIIYLTIAVCEGVLGLRVIVVSIRRIGNEYVLGMRSLW